MGEQGLIRSRIRPGPMETWHPLYLMILVMTSTVVVSYFFYTGDFDPMNMPISDLGATRTEIEGHPNTISFLLFSTGCLISAVLMFIFARNVGHDRRFKNAGTLRLLGLLGGVGFLVLMSPDDTSNWIHRVGGTLSVGSLWAVTMILTFEIKGKIGSGRVFFYNLILHSTLVAYAVPFFLNMEIKNQAQKIGFLGLIFTMFLVMNRLPGASEETGGKGQAG